MEQNPRKIIIRTIGTLFFIFILVFGYSRFGRYINGPQIIDISIEEYQTNISLDILVTGTLKNTETISINGKIVTLDDTYKFGEVIALSPGNNIISVDLEDPFGSLRHYEYNVYSTASEILYETTYNEAKKSLQEQETEALIEINE